MTMTEQMAEAAELAAMPMHACVSKGNIHIDRVPGGWIFRYHEQTDPGKWEMLHAVFVPLPKAILLTMGA